MKMMVVVGEASVLVMRRLQWAEWHILHTHTPRHTHTYTPVDFQKLSVLFNRLVEVADALKDAGNAGMQDGLIWKRLEALLVALDGVLWLVHADVHLGKQHASKHRGLLLEAGLELLLCVTKQVQPVVAEAKHRWQ